MSSAFACICYHFLMTQAKRPPNDRGQGRKPKSPTGELMKPRMMRWTDSGWEDAKLLGMDKVRELVRKAAAKLRKSV